MCEEQLETGGCWAVPGVLLYPSRMHGRYILRARVKNRDMGRRVVAALRDIKVDGEDPAGALFRPYYGSNPWPDMCAVRSFPDVESMLRAAKHVLHQCKPPETAGDVRQLSLSPYTDVPIPGGTSLPEQAAFPFDPGDPR